MAENKTQATQSDVSVFLDSITDERKRADCLELVTLMSEVTGEKAKMWGASIVGFGQYHYKYESGREGDFFLTGFAPRKQNLAIYIVPGFDIAPDLMEKLGKHKTGKSCLYVKTLDDIDRKVFARLVKKSVTHMHKTYPDSK